LLAEDETRLVKNGTPAFRTETNPELPRGVGQKYDFVSFRFNPDGSTDLPPLGTTGKASEGGRWFITVHTAADRARTKSDSEPPPDFFTWMVEPVSGTSKSFRPGVQ
jgi:hypothetical protein